MAPSLIPETGPAIAGSNINLRVLAAAVAFASKDETRYYLQGVCIEIEERGTTYIATDGRSLITYREDLHPDEKDNQLLGKFIIPTGQCKPFKLDKEDEGNATIFGNGRLTIAHGFIDITFLPIDGVFPNWRRVIPQHPANGRPAQFDLEQLATFKKFADALTLSMPFVGTNGGDAPAYVWFSGHPQAMGMVMPFRIQDQMSREAPTWARHSPYPDEQGDIEDAILDEPSNVEDIGKRKKAPTAA